jgi:AcrR family transcriptional regulator
VLRTSALDRSGAAPERARIVEALIEVAAEHGYLDTSIEMILERAGLDRGTFDRHFRGKYDCFLTAWQEINEECMEEMLHAYNSAMDWPDRLRAVAEGTIGSLYNDPSRATFGVEVLAAGDAARARRDMTMRVITSLIDAGRQEMEDPDSVPRTTAEALAGAAYGQIYSKVVRGAHAELPNLIPQLMATAVMPYLGIEASLEELRRGDGAPPGRYRREDEMASEAQKPEEQELPPELARLPAGRHGLPREFIAHNQRERLIAGLAEAVAEHGYGGTTIAHITHHAGVSRRTFYEHFANKDECFVAAYEVVMEKLREQVEAAFEQDEDWPHAVKSGLAAMLAFLAAEPNLARLAMVEAQVAGPAVVQRYDEAIKGFVPFFRAGREEAGANGGASLTPTTEDALVGGMVSLISRRVLAGRTEQLEELLGDLVEFILTPYLGPEEAERIATE